MKALLCVLTVSVTFGIVMAQTTPAQDTPQKGTPTTPQTKTPADSKTGSSGTALPEMKTTTYKGVLIDMSCNSHTSADAATPPSDSSKAAASDQSNSANRSASDSAPSCPVSANSKEMGMKLDDGKVVRFDLVGNQRAQDAVKNDKRWVKDLGANKPIRATVSGVLNGDKLIVASIH
jgi:hypothetical protein